MEPVEQLIRGKPEFKKKFQLQICEKKIKMFGNKFWKLLNLGQFICYFREKKIEFSRNFSGPQ